MPYPTKYNRQYDYVSYQNGNPNKPLPATKVNADLNLVQISTGAIVDFLKKSLRADGKVMNGAIGREQIDPSVNLGFTPPVAWEPNTIYTLNVSTVFYADAFYYAAESHTSGSSFDPSKWVLIANFEALADEAALKAIASNPNIYAISQLVSAADKGIVFTGPGTAMTFDLSAFSRTLLDDPNASTMLSTLGVSSYMQTVLDDADGPTALTTLGALPKAGGTMTGALVLAADPVSAMQAATKQYVDMVAQGLDAKASVVAATTANITLSAPQTIDGIAVIAGDRVLVKNQSTPSQNGVYVVAAGAWSRAADADSWAELPGAFVFVERGTVNADCGFVCTVDQGGTLGTTAVTFTQFSGAGTYSAGTGLALTGTQFSLAAAADGTIKSNISGGSAAPTDNPISAVLDKLLGNTRGSVIYRGASGWTSRAPGTSGQFWKTNGAGADPDWSAVPGGGDMLASNNLSDLASIPTARSTLGIKDRYVGFYNGRNSTNPYALGGLEGTGPLSMSRTGKVLDPGLSSGFDTGGVRGVTPVRVGDEIYLYYGAVQSTNRMCIMMSVFGLNGQLKYRRSTPIIYPGGGVVSSETDVDRPSVLYEPLDLAAPFKMVFSNGAAAAGGTKLYAATSMDGISNWTILGVIATLGSGWESTYIDSMGRLLNDNGTYRLFYGGYDGTSWRGGEMHATTFGLSGWTRNPSNPLLSPRGGYNVPLTADVTLRNSTIKVANSALFDVGAPVVIGDASGPGSMFSGVIGSIPDGTTITLRDPSPGNYTVANSAIISQMHSRSVQPIEVWFDTIDSKWKTLATCFQMYPGRLVETIGYAETSSLSSGFNWVPGTWPLPLNLTYSTWDQIAAENMRVVKVFP